MTSRIDPHDAARRKSNYTGGRPKDPSKLSTNPAQIRQRLRRGVNRDEDMRLYAEVSPHFKHVEDWDLEELAHGKPRNKNGNFGGRAPGWITPEVIREARKRLVDYTNGLLGAEVEFAVQTMIKLVKDNSFDEKGRPVVDARTKLDACKFIIEHVKGKATALVELDAKDNVRAMLAAAIVLDDGAPQDEPVILEGEFTEDDDTDA